MGRHKRRAPRLSDQTTAIVPLPKRRRLDEQAPTTVAPQKVVEQDSKTATSQAFAIRLNKAFMGEAKRLENQKKRLNVEELNEKLMKKKIDLEITDRLWRGFFDDADQAGGFPAGTIYATVGAGHDLVDKWKSYLEDHFNEIKELAIAHYERCFDQENAGKDGFSDPSRVRCVSSTLDKVLRSDESQEHRSLFQKRCQQTAIILSDIKQNLCIMLQMLMMQSWAPASYLQQASSLKKKNVTEATNKKHQIWQQLVVRDGDFERKSAPGLSQTIIESIGELSVNVENMWNGKLFSKSLDRLLLVCLRTSLAPKREAKYVELIQKKQHSKHNDHHNETTAGIDSIRQALRKCNKNVEKCKETLERCLDASKQDAWKTRLSLAAIQKQKLLEKLNQAKVDKRKSCYKEKSGNPIPTDLEDTEIDVTGLEDMEIDVTDLEDMEIDVTDLEDMEIDVTNLEDMEIDFEDTKIDVSAKKLRAYKAILKNLLLQDEVHEHIQDQVKSRYSEKDQLSQHELSTLDGLYKTIKPFVPSKEASKSIPMMLPLVMISNIIQQVASYPQYHQNICPLLAAGATHSFAITARSLYEMMASREVKENFTIFTANNIPLTNLRSALSHGRSTFGSFFDMKKVDELCASRGLLFRDRIVYCADGTIQIIGELRPEKNIVRSFFNDRKSLETRSTRRSQKKRSDLKPNEQVVLDGIEATIEQLQTKLKNDNAAVRNCEKIVAAWKQEQRKLTEQGVSYDIELHLKSKSAKLNRSLSYQAASKTRMLLKQERSRKYWLLQPKDASAPSKAPPEAPVPTNAAPAHEDDVKFLDIKQVLKGAEEENRPIMFSGTDYGVVTMSTSVPMSMDRFKQHMKLYNRFFPLSTLPDSQGPSNTTDDNHSFQSELLTTSSESLAVPLKEKCYRLTAGQVSQKSLGRRHQHKREKRKTEEVKKAEDVLKKNSIAKATTEKQLIERQKACQQQKTIIRQFYQSSRCKKESRERRHLHPRAWDILTSEERRFLSGDEKNTRKVLKTRLIMCIGQAGTGVNSRIQAHLRFGGGQMRKRHRRYQTVAMANEHNTSKTCATCFSPVVRPKRMVNGKKRSVNGSSLCYNHLCPTYAIGNNTKNRDTEAAKCIAIKAIHELVHRTPLPPFSTKPSQFQTGQNNCNNQAPRQDGGGRAA